MDRAQELLFSDFPRAVGVTTPDYDDMELRQFLVHSPAEFSGVIERTQGERNLYASLSSYKPVKVDGSFEGSAVRADKVSFDFDSTAKLSDKEKEQYGPDEDTPNWSHPQIPEFATDNEVIQMMKDDKEVREAVLGDVAFNVQKLAQECIDQGMPIIGVFSGFGVHVHMLHEPTLSRPGDKMLSTCNKWVSELKLSCADEKASGRPFRIMRIPNVERVCHEDGVGTGLYTIPLTPKELADSTPDDYISASAGPRRSFDIREPHDRPEMKVHEDHLGPQYQDGVGQEKMRDVPEVSHASETAEVLLKEYIQMPCVYERALGANPPNDVRVKTGIMLLNALYEDFADPVGQAVEIIAGLNWVDFDREVTKYQLKKLKKSGKGDWSCKTMQGKGLCTRADEKLDCPTYGYQGGNKPWKT